MIKITPNYPLPTVSTTKAKAVTPVEPTARDKAVTEEIKPFMERRKNPDRRKGAKTRGKYEMRTKGPGRRKTDRNQPHIDTEV